MRKTIMTTVVAAAIGFTGIVAASAQTTAPGAPASNQSNVTGATTTDNGAMNSQNKMMMKKKKMMKKKGMMKGDGMMDKKM